MQIRPSFPGFHFSPQKLPAPEVRFESGPKDFLRTNGCASLAEDAFRGKHSLATLHILWNVYVKRALKAGLPGRVSDYIYVSKKDQITGDDLKAFVFSSTITGFGPDGSQWSIDSTKDGTVTIRASWVPGGVDTGRIWLEGDKVCSQFQYHNFGMVNCGTTFKNPKGIPETMNEYVRFNDPGPAMFSRTR